MKTPFDQSRNNLDCVRLALALLVIFSHSYAVGTGSEAREPFAVLTRGQVTGGHIAVDLFFIVSGFLITASAERSKTIWRFMKKRVFRIYPAFCLVALFTVVVFLPLSSGSLAPGGIPSKTIDVVTKTLTLREFSYRDAFLANPYPGVVNGSLWSISYEFWCYIGVALLSVSGLLRSKAVLFLLFAASIVLSMYFSLSGWNPGGKILGVIFGYPPFWGRLLPMYMAGIIFYKIRDVIRIRPSWIIASSGLLIVAAVTPHGWALLFPFAGTYLVFAFAYHPVIPHIDASRFGDLSYGTYLYAFPVQQLIVKWIGHAVHPWVLFLLAAPVTLLLALGSWYGVERWFLRKTHKGPSPLRAELYAQSTISVSQP